jgi:hypothetical protein
MRGTIDTDGLITRWIEALESGTYKQGFYTLRNTDPASGETCWCAEGVLCDVSGMGEWIPESDGFPGDFSYLIPGREPCDCVAPFEVITATGFLADISHSVVLMNDVHRLSFVEIADRLRSIVAADVEIELESDRRRSLRVTEITIEVRAEL